MAIGLDQTKKLSGAPLHPKTVLVLLAALDLVATFLRVIRRYDMTNVPLPWPSLFSPIHYYIDPALLLFAAVGLRLDKQYGYVVAIATTLALFYRGYQKWIAISVAVDAIWSRSARSILEYWWTYADGAWDFGRFILAAVTAVYAGFLLFGRLARETKSSR
jgi:hypothetical protein